MKFETKCIHGYKHHDHTGAIGVPIYQTATYSHQTIGEPDPYGYTRLANPTREACEETVASLENGCGALAFSSGLAAISAWMDLFNPGDHLITTLDLYGGATSLFNHFSHRNGVTFTFTDTHLIENIEKAIQPHTKAIYIETPTNPMMHVTDLTAVAAIAKKHGLMFAVDNTFLTPYFQNPLDLGADVVIHSGTKYLSGHNDTLSGFLITKDETLLAQIKQIRTTRGTPLAPLDSFLIIRGIKTLALRMEQAQANAKAIANWLQTQPKVTHVYYIGLTDHPSYDISTTQATGYGAMISFTVDSPDTAKKILLGVKIITFAESLGGVESLLTYPMENTHGEVPEAQRLERGITDKLLRLSIGIENIDDLIADLAQALA